MALSRSTGVAATSSPSFLLPRVRLRTSCFRLVHVIVVPTDADEGAMAEGEFTGDANGGAETIEAEDEATGDAKGVEETIDEDELIVGVLGGRIRNGEGSWEVGAEALTARTA